MSMEAQAAPESDLVRLDQEYAAVCSQLGEAFIAYEASKERLDRLKMQRLKLVDTYKAIKASMQKADADVGS